MRSPILGLYGYVPLLGIRIRGTLPVHGNRLSCKLPETIANASLQAAALVVMGNMVGNGTGSLPEWVSDEEQQPFLFVSTSQVHDFAQQCILFFTGLFLFLHLFVDIFD